MVAYVCVEATPSSFVAALFALIYAKATPSSFVAAAARLLDFSAFTVLTYPKRSTPNGSSYFLSSAGSSASSNPDPNDLSYFVSLESSSASHAVSSYVRTR